ncbi:hypothetical protein [Sphingomicrobium sediminis]|uniref:Uncharacterized protein n=1 Tax=Sphingomicrobium sediminis TaxID=2950949 RepID=A0A9X2EK86_9SPHN|nr:hypothetical protein [Sphingomicrobium sediminis]MCM8556889.1 hypothetical protein [Sphingomicrobium sediminis]
MTQPTDTQTNNSRIDNVRQNLETRGDFVGQSYRTIRDNPRTSAAIAGGVAAAAGATAFLLNRRNRIGTATGHANPNEEVLDKVEEMNADPSA